LSKASKATGAKLLGSGARDTEQERSRRRCDSGLPALSSASIPDLAEQRRDAGGKRRPGVTSGCRLGRRFQRFAQRQRNRLASSRGIRKLGETDSGQSGAPAALGPAILCEPCRVRPTHGDGAVRVLG